MLNGTARNVTRTVAVLTSKVTLQQPLKKQLGPVVYLKSNIVTTIKEANRTRSPLK